MVDDGCHDGLIAYCKSKGIGYKEYPKKAVDPTVSGTPTVNRRKKIPPKSNDSAISDHETSTSCSEGEDDTGYIKSLKAAFYEIHPKKPSTTTSTVSTDGPTTTIEVVPSPTNKVNVPEAN